MNLYELHERMTSRLFPPFSSEDEHFLALALCGETGELADVVIALALCTKSGALANIVKKRWRDDVSMEEAARDEIADCRVYLELLAKRFGIEGEKLDARVESKLAKVAEKHRMRLAGLAAQNG